MGRKGVFLERRSIKVLSMGICIGTFPLAAELWRRTVSNHRLVMYITGRPPGALAPHEEFKDRPVERMSSISSGKTHDDDALCDEAGKGIEVRAPPLKEPLSLV